MGLKHMTHVLLRCIFYMVLVGLVRSDMEAEKQECANQLVGLSPCLQYVTGRAQAPTIDCCSGLKGVITQSPKCLCILIKDRNDPNLGFEINATLAATLPSTCRTTNNVTQCIDILHLPPNSPDAKLFASFANITNKGSSPTSSGSSPLSSGTSTSTGSSSTSSQKNNAVKASHWINGGGVLELLCGLLLLATVTYFHILY